MKLARENQTGHTYCGISVTAAIGRENITGLQFHPERSGHAALKLLSRFSGL
jgi:glutamine amidotransferase